jgi:hypothetical protein
VLDGRLAVNLQEIDALPKALLHVLPRILRGAIVAETGVAALGHLLLSLVKRPPGCLGMTRAVGVGGETADEEPARVASGVTGDARVVGARLGARTEGAAGSGAGLRRS